MRGRSRGVVLLGVALIGVTATALRARSSWSRSSATRRVAGVPAVVRQVGSVRYVESRGAPEELVPDTMAPAVETQLLWLDGRRAAPSPRGAVVIDGAGGVLEVDERLQPHARPLESGGREWLSVAAGDHRSLWLTDATGSVLTADTLGVVRPVTSSSLQFPDVTTDPRTGTPWFVRSARRFSYQFHVNASPLLVHGDATGAPIASVGRAIRPPHVLLEDLANAGQIAIADDMIFFAPFIRDELVAMTFAGETLWVASRGLPQSTVDPRFELIGRRAVVNYHPVNLGVTVGPDHRVYLLSTPGVTTLKSRLDVFDPATGALLRTAQLSTATPSLAADASGRVYLFDAFRVLAGVAPKARQAAPAIDLPALGGGGYVLAAQHGRLQLLNLWASWCAPCREEMPALDSMRKEFRHDSFDFVGVNDDLDVDAARAFLADHNFDFLVALGHGQAKALFNAPGLPVTVLVDRDGREVHRWVGYAGAAQIAAIRAVVRAEIARVPADTGAPMHHHDMSQGM